MQLSMVGASGCLNYFGAQVVFYLHVAHVARSCSQSDPFHWKLQISESYILAALS